MIQSDLFRTATESQQTVMSKGTKKNDIVSNGFHLYNEWVSASIYILYVHNDESAYCIIS